MKIFLIIIGSLLAIAAIYLGYRHFTKQNLVNQIMARYGNEPNFDASPERLKALPISTLRDILSGKLK